jgi:heat shock protein HslJ
VLRDAIGVEHLRFEPDDVSALESGEWRLTSFVRDGVTTTADPTQPAVLAFRPTPGSPADGAERRSRGDLVGSSGCNGIVGTYARSGDVLSLGPLDVSDAPCPDALAAQESAVLGVLDSEALLLDLPADQLTLSVTDGGDRLEYVAGDPLEGTTWRLDRLAGTAPPTQPITLHLAEGRLSGEGPCGAYEGAYATDGRFLTFRELEPGGRQGCPRADRQRALLAALADTVLAERARPGLRLLDVRGRVVARFSRAAAGP